MGFLQIGSIDGAPLYAIHTSNVKSSNDATSSIVLALHVEQFLIIQPFSQKLLLLRKHTECLNN